MKVLIMDESAAVRERLFDVLSEFEGVESLTQAGHWPEALALIQTVAPDVVVFDIDTHEGHWMDILRQVKAGCPSPRVIVLTNSTHPHVRARCVDLGADFFLDKSTEFDRVVDVLKSLP
jgi:DNA-binding NarL/FixJ family response regulator